MTEAIKKLAPRRAANATNAMDRTPEDGWDCGVNVRQGRRWLRERGDTVRSVFPGEALASDLAAGKKAPTQEDVDKSHRADLGIYIRQLRAFGIRPRTAT